MKESFTRAVCWMCIITLVMSLIYVLMQSAEASGSHHQNTDVTNNYYNTYIKKDDDAKAQGIVIGMALTCGIASIYTKIKRGRWTWCGISKDTIYVPDRPEDKTYIFEAK